MCWRDNYTDRKLYRRYVEQPGRIGGYGNVRGHCFRSKCGYDGDQLYDRGRMRCYGNAYGKPYASVIHGRLSAMFGRFYAIVRRYVRRYMEQQQYGGSQCWQRRHVDGRVGGERCDQLYPWRRLFGCPYGYGLCVAIACKRRFCAVRGYDGVAGRCGDGRDMVQQ